jgi:hypothetical protein
MELEHRGAPAVGAMPTAGAHVGQRPDASIGQRFWSTYPVVQTEASMPA